MSDAEPGPDGTAALGEGRAQERCEAHGGRPSPRVERECAIHGLQQRLRQVGPDGGERRRACLDRPGALEQRRLPERMSARERLPEHHADAPDVARAGRLLAREPLRRDVRERSRHVAGRGQRLGLVHAGEPEVQQPDGDAIGVREQDVRRLDVAVDDSARVRVRERVEHLRRGLHRLRVSQLARAERLAQRPARHVLVGDVDVLVVVRERVGAQAALVTEPGRGRCLALRPRAGLAVARDDLERNFDARCLVSCEPDRPGAAASKRAHGPVAAENERARGRGGCGSRHLVRRWRLPVRFLRRPADGIQWPVVLGPTAHDRAFRRHRIRLLRRAGDRGSFLPAA